MPATRFELGDGTVTRSRELRRDATPAERRLWSVLRAGALEGRKFRRQQRLGPFLADFVCQSARLVIEVDGASHAGEEARRYDARRTAFLDGEGYRVIRFVNADVLTNLDGVTTAVRAALAGSDASSPSHSALPSGSLPLPRGERM